MSATIGSNVQIKEILKATGFDCPAELEGKTFSEATAGGTGDNYGKYLVLDIEATPVYDPDLRHYNVVVDFSKYADTYIQLPFNNAYLYPIEQLERVLQNNYLDKDGNVIGSGYEVYIKDSQTATFTYLPADKRVTKIVSYIADESLKLYEINVSYPE